MASLKNNKKIADQMIADLQKEISKIELAQTIIAERLELGIDKTPCHIRMVLEEIEKLSRWDNASICRFLVNHRARHNQIWKRLEPFPYATHWGRVKNQN